MNKKRYTGNKGFTLGEMLITVAIVTILVAVTIVNVVPYVWNLRLKDADQAAHEIYLAAQYHLSSASSTGALNVYNTSQLGTEDNLYTGTNYQASSGDHVYDIVVSPDQKKPAILDAVLPYGSVDETLRSSGSYIITYDYDSATVLGVFFSYANKSYGYPFSITDLSDKADALHKAMASDNGNISSEGAKTIRRHFPDGSAKHTIGFYGGEDTGASAKVSDAPILYVDNGDTLDALISLNKEQVKPGYYLQLRVYGTDSQKTEVKNLQLSDLTKKDDSYVYTLDAFQDKTGGDSLQFAKQFDKLYAGENITVTARIVKSTNNTYTNVSKFSDPVHTNSLFGSLNNGKAIISSIRHLENLGKFNDYVKVTSASQVSDITFSNYIVNLENRVGIKTDNVKYEPVNLKQSLIYDGSYTYTDSDNSKTARQHLLSGTVTETDKDGGVFGTLTGSTSALKVTGLEVMDINVKADGHAGALLGQASDGATFETDNVLVWSKSADLSIQSTGGDAGGLIGRGSGNVTINNSAASIYVKGSGNAGGLAGYASNLTVDKSYASGHTYQSKYIDRTDISDENGNQRYNIIAGNGYAGGLAGSVNHIQKISSSYTTASVHSGTEANSAAFVGNNSNFIGDGSYAVTSLNGKAVKEPSDFTGNAGTKTKYVNDETLLGTESAVTYPYSTISELAGSNLDNATWFLSAHVGDWTAETQSKAETSFNNKEILQFITTVPDVSADDEIEVQFFYGNTYKDQYGNTQRMGVYGMSDLSQTPALTFTFKNGKIYSINNYYNYANLKTWNTKTPDDWRSNLCKIKPEGNQTTFTINLDDITYYKNGNLGSFANVLSNVLGIAPGYDVTARVVENGTVISDPVVTNSLYGDQTTADTIVVSCGRHLQNLDPSVSNNKWTDANISKINLTSDIAWNSTSDSFFDRVNNLRINPSDTVDGVYAGSQIVSNKKFLSINGYNFNNSNNAVVFEGNGHTISDINFHVNDDASGLFSKIHDFTVQDLTILNGQIEAENNVQAAGLLAGYYSNGSVKNCYAVGENSAVRIGNSQYAGGLVGYMQSTDMTNCGASVYVQGSIAGGLVGDFNSGSISRSFSGGRTTNGSYLENAKVKGYYNVEGYTDAGGLVGQSGGTITHCYSTSSVYSGNNQSILPHWGYTSGNGHAGGLIGKTGNQKAVNNSYAVGMVLGPQGSAGALIGYYDNYGFDDSVVNNYYLEGINVDVSTMKELPAVGGPNQTVYINGQTQSLTEGHMSCVNYYSSDSNPIARADDSKVHYFTYSYDSTLQGSYPYVSWTRQADNVSTHYGGWQIPINKPTLCHILLLDSDGTTKVAETSVSYGTDWASQFEQYSAQLSSKKVDGKSFVGWVDSNGNPVTESSFASVITDITATAKYASEVSFYYEDPETGNNEFISTAVVKDSDMSVNVPSYPSFNGYSFEGWFIDNNNTAVVKNNKIYNPSASKYTAKYKKQVIYTYKVLFCYEEKNGTPGNRITSLNTHTYERTNDNYQSFNQEISLMGITAPYGQLDKLYAVNDDTGDKILDQPLHSADNKVTITGYAADVTYYVLFISKQVTYNVEHIFKNSSDLYKQAKVENGLLQNGDELAYDPYSQVTLTETKPGNAGSMTAATIIENLGDGWELDGNIQQQSLPDDNTTVVKIYYSRKSYQETFNTGKGTYLSPRLIPYGKNVTLPNADDVVNTGYKLNAWKVEYGSVSVTLDPGSSFVMPAENVTVTAVWEESKTADVTIQIWQQRPFTKTKYTTSDYDYAGSYTVTDQKVGETYTTSDPAVRRNLGTQVSFDHFHYKGVIIGAGDAITDGAISLTVNADGNNVVNLYYDRDQITINFYYHDLIYYDYYTHTGYYTYPKTKPDYSWKGLYGEEFGDKYKWNTDYDWYSSRNPVQVRRKWYYEPSGSRLTFITYFHVEENYRDKNNKNTMNLYGFTASKGNSYIRHWVENLDGDGWTPKNDSESEYYTSFTFSNKYPYGFELDHYSHPEDWFGYIETGKAKENQTELVKNGLNIYYTRKNIQITLLNAVVNNDDSQVPYQFQEKYETGYDRIAKDLEKLSISKPDNVDGEEFVGWYLDPNYTKEFTGDVNSKLTQKLQLFAKWKKSQYHIYFYDEAGNQLGEKDVATGDQLYNSDTGVNDFPSVSAPDGHEVRWYYTDSNGKERQFIKDRKIMKDLLRSDDVGTDGYYTIHLKAKVMAAGEVNLTYQLVDQNGNKITYNGESTFTTAEKYTIGTEFNIVPPEIDGYTYMSGANGVAYDGTEKNPIKLYYNLSKGSWQYEKRLYAIYQDIDDSTKSEISVEIPTDNPVVSTEKEETVENSPRVDGYTFASSAVLKKGESSAERTTSSQLSLEKDNGSGQTAAFWYHPKWTGKLSDTTAVYDGSEHGVTFTPDHMPVIGDNTVVYKYTYTQTLAKTSESTVQYVWNDANGSHTSGKAPVNAGVYTVKVDVLLYNGTSLSENTLLNSSGSLLTVYSHEFDDGLNISPADVEITSANGSWAYDGQPHSLNSWSVSVNGTSVTQNESPVTVKFLQPYSTITEPGINVNRFTYEIKDGYLADNYKVTSNPGSLKVEWEYKVRYVLSLPDCVYEAKSDADKKKAEAAGKDVKPIQITMFENTDASPQPAPTFNDSSQEALDLEGLKRTDSGNQTIRYTDKDAVVTYTYTLDLDDVKLKKADDGSLQIVISDKDETKQKVLAALKPYLQAVKNTDSKDDDSETEKTPYETYQDTKNKDYRIVYRFTYTDAAKTDTAVTYLVNEDGTMVTDKPVSGNVPSAAGDYNVSGEILVQHRTETTDEEGNVTESWNDGNILWQSSTPENITIK